MRVPAMVVLYIHHWKHFKAITIQSGKRQLVQSVKWLCVSLSFLSLHASCIRFYSCLCKAKDIAKQGLMIQITEIQVFQMQIKKKSSVILTTRSINFSHISSILFLF